MEWVCLYDRSSLKKQEERLICNFCGRSYSYLEDISVFACDGEEDETARPDNPRLADLWKLLQKESVQEAAADYCATKNLNILECGPNWSFFFSRPESGHTLEIGSGFGDDTLKLLKTGAAALSIVPSRVNARILARRLSEEEGVHAEIAVLPSIAQLPLADGSVGAILALDLGESGFDLGAPGLKAVAAEWRRVMGEKGVVYLGISNPFSRLPGAKFVRRLLARVSRPSLNRAVRIAPQGPPAKLFSLRSVVRSMTHCGFKLKGVYAPLPDENNAEVIVPLDNRQMVLYLLEKLIPDNSLALQAVLAALTLMVRLKLFHLALPYYFVVLETPDRPQRHKEKKVRTALNI